jgi:predicted trehalose synthase
MLRSFSLAQEAGLRAAATHPAEATQFAPLAEAWAQQARAAFLAAYGAAADGAGLYDTLDPAHGLLGLFVLEQALRELHGELDTPTEGLRSALHTVRALAG